jgi:tetratricopeptide (TPR) repeat protein
MSTLLCNRRNTTALSLFNSRWVLGQFKCCDIFFYLPLTQKMTKSPKKLLFYLFIFLSFPSIGFGQQTHADSLLALFHDEQLADTVRIKALIDLGESAYAKSNPDSIEFYLAAAGNLALEQISSGDQFRYYYGRALALYRSSRYQESLLKAELAEELAQFNQDTTAQIRVLGFQSNCYRDLSDFSAAIETGTDALLLAERVGNQHFIAVLYSHIGLIYGQFMDFEKARENLFKSLRFQQEEKILEGEVVALTNIGWTYSQEKNYEKAIEYNLKALAIAEEIDLRRYMGTTLLNVGEAYFNLNKMELASGYITRGITVARIENEWPAIARGAVQMAHLYRESRSDTAFHYAQEALDLAKKLGNQTIIENAVQVLYQLYEDKGEYKQALEMHKLWKLTLDSIFSEKNQAALYQNEAKYEYEKQKLKDELAYAQDLSALKLRDQKHFYLLLTSSLVLATLFFFVFRKRQIQSALERKSLLHEMELLKQRVATHSISVDQVQEGMKLDKERIETHLGTAIGESSWNILNVIYENPTISNRQIAKQVFLSLEGVSSSLRRMYRNFEVKSGSSKNLKVALVTKVIQISLEKENESGPAPFPLS